MEAAANVDAVVLGTLPLLASRVWFPVRLYGPLTFYGTEKAGPPLNFKPMLACDCVPVEELVFPLIASPKLDGVRCIITAEGALSRTLKPIPNVNVQQLLEGLPIGLDGELMVGEPTAPDVYRKTV